MNLFLLLTVMTVSLFSLRGAYVEHLLGTVICLIVLGSGMWFFIQEIRKDQFSVHNPLGYLSFYFLILFIVLITGSSLSILFPETFLLAVLFGVTNAGRKISFAIALMSVTTIGLLYLDTPVTSGMIYRMGLTVVLLVVIPQVAGYIYNKKVREASKHFLYSDADESS